MPLPDSLECGTCGAEVAGDEAIRRKTFGDLDSDRWQTLCCPDCGARLRTIFVGPDA
jgi:DNA-directed RNA polymerase subunit RPC12/RpoP